MTARIRGYHPIVEVYIQNLAPDAKLGTAPTKDEYFLGQFDGKDGTNVIPLSHNHGSFKATGALSRPFSVQYLPSGFAAATVPDWRLLDLQRYEFTFIRREFVGEARTLVLDIRPKANSGMQHDHTTQWPTPAATVVSSVHRVARMVVRPLTENARPKAARKAA